MPSSRARVGAAQAEPAPVPQAQLAAGLDAPAGRRANMIDRAAHAAAEAAGEGAAALVGEQPHMHSAVPLDGVPAQQLGGHDRHGWPGPERLTGHCCLLMLGCPLCCAARAVLRPTLGNASDTAGLAATASAALRPRRACGPRTGVR